MGVFTKRNFPADVFDSATSWCILRHFSHGLDCQGLAIQIDHQYRASINDPLAVYDIAHTAEASIHLLSTLGHDRPSALAEAFHKHCITFHPSGRPARKFLKGLWFNRDLPDPDRQARFLERLTRFTQAHDFTSYAVSRIKLVKG